MNRFCIGAFGSILVGSSLFFTLMDPSIVLTIIKLSKFSLQLHSLPSLHCEFYFHGKSWPKPKVNMSLQNSVKLCQTTIEHKSPAYLATFYNMDTKIPIYSANRVKLSNNSPVFPRPSTNSWNRISLTLCKLKQVPSYSIPSQIVHRDNSYFDCDNNQATAKDYHENGLNLDKGHLSPNAINDFSRMKQLSTFTLTNAAPQYAKFNEQSWRVYECVTKQAIIDLAPNEDVYIITGTLGVAKNSNGSDLWMNEGSSDGKTPVLVPGYFWKAVCYPGNKNLMKSPWGFAIIEENVDIVKHANVNAFMKLQRFSENYFHDDLFGPECMNATFGSFNQIIQNWKNYLHQHC